MIELAKYQRRNQILFYIALFMPLLGFNIVAYAYLLLYFLFILATKSKYYSSKGTIIGLLIFSFLVVKYIQIGEFDKTRIVMQYYFGVALMMCYLYFSKTIIIDIDKLILIFCGEIILEAVLVNTIISPSILPNYPLVHIQLSGYQRPMSIGCNTTVTATILCMLLTHRETLRKNGVLEARNKIDAAGGFAIVVLSSGLGMGLWLLYFAYRMKGRINTKSFSMIFVAGLLMLPLLAIPSIKKTLYNHIWGSDGTSFALSEFKQEETESYLSDISGFSNIVGLDFKRVPLLTQGDLAYLEMFLSVGVVGILIYVLVVLNYINKYNRIALIIGLIGLYHYGGIFSMPGQLVFGYLLLFNSHKLNILKSNIPLQVKGLKNKQIKLSRV